MSLLNSLCTRALPISRNQRKGNDLSGRGVGAVVLQRWYRAKRRPKSRRVLKTLNSERLVQTGQETFDISGYHYANLHQGNLTCGLNYCEGIRFPPGTKGFLYYHQPPALPPVAGGMRFRICEDASKFAEGSDLELEPGRPWNPPLVNIMRTARFEAIRELLVNEGSVDHELVADIDNMAVEGSGFTRGGTALYDIDQPFCVDLNIIHLLVRLITRSCLRGVVFRPFSMQTPGSVRHCAFNSGRIRARFELGMQDSNPEKRVLHMRVLEILTPITRNPPPKDYTFLTEIIAPRPGELISRKRGSQALKPWAFPIFRKHANAEAVGDFLAEREAEKEKYGV